MNKHDHLRTVVTLAIDRLSASIDEAANDPATTAPLRSQRHVLRAVWQALDSRKGSRGYEEAVEALGRIGSDRPGHPFTPRRS